MIQPDYHRLLRRQLRKAKFNQKELDLIGPFLEKVDAAYKSYSSDLKNLEHTLEISSQELYQRNQILKLDVTAKQKELFSAKTQLDNLVNNVSEVIFQTDKDGNWIFLNKSWERLFGYSVVETVGHSYKTFIDLVIPEDKAHLFELVHSKESLRTGILRVKTRSGEIKWIEISIKMVFTPEGYIDGSIGTLVDVTSLKTTEKELRKAEKKEKQANLAKDDFLSVMSHEIRTPLNVVIGMANLLLMNDPKPCQLENLETLKLSSEHLLALINDILDFSKIQAGKIELEEAPFSLEKLLIGLQKTFEHHAQEKGLKLIFQKHSELPSMVIGDSTRLSQVMNNLISNAIKFTSVGLILIDVSVRSSNSERVLIDFSVTDTGLGIAKEKLNSIFDTFTQAEASTTRKFGGTGLGLSICQKLLAISKSNLQVESELDKGTRFFFTLEFGQSNPFDQVAINEDLAMNRFESLSGVRALVAEDNRMNVMVVSQLFKKWGIELDVAANGKEAVNLFMEKEYDLILMDLQMPVMDGIEATKIIRQMENKDGNKIPIVALTANADVETERKSLNAGMNEFVSKPFNPTVLNQKLKQLLLQEEQPLASTA